MSLSPGHGRKGGDVSDFSDNTSDCSLEDTHSHTKSNTTGEGEGKDLNELSSLPSSPASSSPSPSPSSSNDSCRGRKRNLTGACATGSACSMTRPEKQLKTEVSPRQGADAYTHEHTHAHTSYDDKTAAVKPMHGKVKGKTSQHGHQNQHPHQHPHPHPYPHNPRTADGEGSSVEKEKEKTKLSRERTGSNANHANHANHANQTNQTNQTNHGCAQQGSESEEEKLDRIAAAYTTIIECLGEDPSREGLLKTPMRAAKAMLFFCKGYTQSLDEIVNDAIFEEEGRGMVVVKDIPISSLCEHHLVPFTGKIHIAYLPQGRVLGLSKFARVAEWFARRLQVQERITREVAHAITRILSPRGVAVVMEASHMCMVMRGVEKHGSSTTTSCMRGAFETDALLRQELWAHLRR